MNVILAIAKTTLGEAIRRRVLLVILLVGVLFVAIAPALEALSPRQELTVLRSLTLGVIQLTSAVIAVVLTVYLIPNEIERRTIYTILSKPVRRWQFMIGKYLGAVGALGLMMALMTGIMLLVFVVMGKSKDVSDLAMLAKVPIAFFIQMSLLAAVSVFFSTFASPIVNFFLSGGVYLVGTMFDSFFNVLTKETQPLIVKIPATIVHVIIPNFQSFNVQNSVINPTQVIQNETMLYVGLSVYAVTYISILMILGIIVFEYREV
ncbi:MAG: ABC transporter permease [Armatimonadetes bacterium]|nr:ABC transporter permease [Armatimonadota bacterium]